MNGSTERRLTVWSARVYRLVLRFYPVSFQLAFGESMAQLYGDLARDGWRRGGPGGLLRVWIRTAFDVPASLVQAYASERRESMFRTTAIAGMIYLGLLTLAVGYGAAQYGEFYSAPSFNRLGATGAGEDALLSAYEVALAGRFGEYRSFAFGTGALLAVALGLAAALFGVWQRSLLHGTGAFAVGAAATVGALSLIPTVWFPLDSYPVAVLWVMGGGLPLAVAVWLLATAIGWFGLSRPLATPPGATA